MPENVLKKIHTRITPPWKACFWAALFVGLLAHLYKITNWLPNWDSLVFRYDPQNMVAIGRWFLPVICAVSSFYDLPFLNGLLAILFHALGAVCICEIFHVQKKTTACLIGAVIVSFPTVTSVMMYNYVADGYGFAFLLSVLAAWCLTKEKPRYVAAAVCVALSAGIYQAYITVTVVLVLLKLIDEMLYHNVSFAALWKKTVYMALSGVAGVAVYTLVLKLLLYVTSTELLEYQGANATASLGNFNLAASLYVIKETFFGCFFDTSDGVNAFVIVNLLLLVLTLVYYIKNVVSAKLYKRVGTTVAVVLFGGMLVLGAGAVAFVNASVDYHNLMRMGYVVFYLCFLLLYERGVEKNQKQTAVKRWLVLALSTVLIFTQVLIANVSYHKAQLAYEKSYGVLIRIADRIEQTPQAEDCDKILVLGALDNSKSYSVNLTPEITGITDGYILRADDEVVGQSVLCSALADYCEKDYQFISGEEKQKLAQTDIVQAMGVWPAKDCVAVIDDTVIVKLGVEGES